MIYFGYISSVSLSPNTGRQNEIVSMIEQYVMLCKIMITVLTKKKKKRCEQKKLKFFHENNETCILSIKYMQQYLYKTEHIKKTNISNEI